MLDATRHCVCMCECRVTIRFTLACVCMCVHVCIASADANRLTCDVDVSNRDDRFERLPSAIDGRVDGRHLHSEICQLSGICKS